MDLKAQQTDEPGKIRIGPGVQLPKSVLRFSFARSSGPGGQHVNKVNTKAYLHLSLEDLGQALSELAMDRLKSLARSRINKNDELVLSSSISRSQRLNRHACLDRLRELVLQANSPVRQRKRRRISTLSHIKRLEAKHRHSLVKQSRKRIKEVDK